MNHEFQFVCIKLTGGELEFESLLGRYHNTSARGPLNYRALGVFKAGSQKGARHFLVRRRQHDSPSARSGRNSPIIAEFERVSNPRLGLSRYALREGWRVPRNPGSADNRRQRFFKCNTKFWGHLCTPIWS